jgi:hypothetical protein
MAKHRHATVSRCDRVARASAGLASLASFIPSAEAAPKNWDYKTLVLAQEFFFRTCCCRTATLLGESLRGKRRKRPVHDTCSVAGMDAMRPQWMVVAKCPACGEALRGLRRI